MGNERAEELIRKYLQGTATPEEEALLESWYITAAQNQPDMPGIPDYEKIKDGTTNLYCRGFIEYRGIHLLADEPSYRTPFYKKWITLSAIPTVAESGGYWDDYPDAEANRNT